MLYVAAKSSTSSTRTLSSCTPGTGQLARSASADPGARKCRSTGLPRIAEGGNAGAATGESSQVSTVAGSGSPVCGPAAARTGVAARNGSMRDGSAPSSTHTLWLSGTPRQQVIKVFNEVERPKLLP